MTPKDTPKVGAEEISALVPATEQGTRLGMAPKHSFKLADEVCWLGQSLRSLASWGGSSLGSRLSANGRSVHHPALGSVFEEIEQAKSCPLCTDVQSMAFVGIHARRGFGRSHQVEAKRPDGHYKIASTDLRRIQSFVPGVAGSSAAGAAQLFGLATLNEPRRHAKQLAYDHTQLIDELTDGRSAERIAAHISALT